MKVVDVSEFYSELGGGVRTYTNQKLEAGARAGHEVVIVAPGPEDREEERLGGRIIWVKGPKLPPDPRYYLLLRERAVHEILDREAPDVVEGSSTWTAGWFVARWEQARAVRRAAKALVFHQDPIAVHPHTFLDRWLPTDTIDDFFGPWWRVLGRLTDHYDATVVAGQWLADRLADRGIRGAHAVPFGVPKRALPELDRGAARARWLQACGLPPDAPLVVGISRHHWEKRLGTLFDALEQVDRPVGFVLFGDGPMRGWVDRRAAKTRGVHVAGFTKDRELLASALVASDAFLHGSAAETFGLVVAEALVAGLPLIVPSRGGAGDLADPSWSETYEPGDAPGCARAIERMLDSDLTGRRIAAAAAGRDRVRSVEQHFDQLFAFYDSLAGGVAPAG